MLTQNFYSAGKQFPAGRLPDTRMPATGKPANRRPANRQAGSRLPEAGDHCSKVVAEVLTLVVQMRGDDLKAGRDVEDG